MSSTAWSHGLGSGRSSKDSLEKTEWKSGKWGECVSHSLVLRVPLKASAGVGRWWKRHGYTRVQGEGRSPNPITLLECSLGRSSVSGLDSDSTSSSFSSMSSTKAGSGPVRQALILRASSFFALCSSLSSVRQPVQHQGRHRDILTEGTGRN